MQNLRSSLLFQLAEIPWHLFRLWEWPRRLPPPALYRFGPHPRQYLLWLEAAPGAEERKSVVVFYHGGGWRVGRPGFFPLAADFFRREGFAVALPAYRLTPRFFYPHMREDLNLALLRILDILAERGLQEKKILSSGMSAGAALAAHLAFNRLELERLQVPRDRFSGFLSFAGPLDLNKISFHRPVRLYAGGLPGSPAFLAANPVHWLAPDENLPALLLHGTIDSIVPIACSESFATQYPAPQALQFVRLPNRTHLDALRFGLDDREAAAAVHTWLQDK